MDELWQLGVRDLVAGFDRGAHTASDMVRSLMARSEACAELHAWATTSFGSALAGAQRLDSAMSSGAELSALPLRSVPFGVKDIIATKDIPTGFGVRQPVVFGPVGEAGILTRVDTLGGLIAGKTATTAFAGGDPAVTLNPWNPRRTPGGSSSGSAAGVAAGLMPIAFGTQTAGSVLRPAAYCGVVGFKPTFDTFPMSGVFPFAPSLDTIGLLGRSVDDIEYIFDALIGKSEAASTLLSANPVRFVKLDLPGLLTPDAAEHFDVVVNRLRAAGATVDDAEFPVDFELVLHAHRVIVYAEAYRVHREMLNCHPHLYGPGMVRSIRLGSLVPPDTYERARRLQRELSEQLHRVRFTSSMYLLPTVGAAAPNANTTGDSRLQALATMLGTPSLTLPTGRDSEGMPLGTQLIARRGEDSNLLKVGRWVEERLGTRVIDFPNFSCAGPECRGR